MAAPAAPVVVEGGALAALTGALLLAILVWAALFGLQQFYTYTFGALLHGIKSALNAIPLVKIGDATVGKIDSFVQAQIGTALSAAEVNVGRTWHALSYVARLTAETVELLAHATLDALDGITRSTIPEQIAGSIAPAATRLAGTVAALRLTVSRMRLDLYARVGTLEHDLDRLFGRAWQGIDKVRADARAQARAIAGGLAADLGALNRYAHGALNHRLTRLEERLAGAAITAGAIAALSRIAPWVRCSNVGKLGRTVCRTETNFLDALLAGSLLIVGTISLAQFARELREPTDLVMDGLEGFVRELRGIG